MKLWLIPGTKDENYSCNIIAAENEEKARRIFLDFLGWVEGRELTWDYFLKTPDTVTIKLLGKAEEEIPEGIILSSADFSD